SEGRVHLSGLSMMARYLSSATVDELLAAATHKSKAQIERLLAERFPKPDLPALVRTLPQAPTPASLQPAGSEPSLDCPVGPQGIAKSGSQLAPGQVEGRVVLGQPDPWPDDACARIAPLAPQRYGVQFTLDRAGYDLLRHVQDLLGQQV